MPRLQSRAAALLLAVSIAAAPLSALADVVKVPEGTEFLVRFDDKLSSATNTQGDQFSISLDESVKLADGTLIAEGYRGKGEVTSASKRGYVGKAGDLSVRLQYIRIGDTRVRLRANKASEGKGAMGATIALTVLFGPLGLLKRGHDIEIKEGQTLTAYVDQDAEITTPLTPPPPEGD